MCEDTWCKAWCDTTLPLSPGNVYGWKEVSSQGFDSAVAHGGKEVSRFRKIQPPGFTHKKYRIIARVFLEK
jgi:hypothetical protein